MFTIPNIITLLNLFCGCLGFIAIWEGKQPLAAYLVFWGALFDLLDGLVARLTKSYSDIGKQLDSLADMVTFGALPAVLMFDLMRRSASERWATMGLFLAVFAALRLAKFNIDTRQSDKFIGLPTPAMAIAVASIPLIMHYSPAWRFVLEYNFLLIYVVLLCWAMVAEMPLMSFKFKTWDWENNQARYHFIAIALLSLAILKFLAIPFLVVVYIVWSMFFEEEEEDAHEIVKEPIKKSLEKTSAQMSLFDSSDTKDILP
jgi:CDP-diacylglycerol--serine O-phosphatidyltransferase